MSNNFKNSAFAKNLRENKSVWITAITLLVALAVIAAVAAVANRAKSGGEDTTEPPETNEVKTSTSNVSSVLTSETPETAASPARATIIESAVPMVMDRICCRISGKMMLNSARPENSGALRAGAVGEACVSFIKQYPLM